MPITWYVSSVTVWDTTKAIVSNVKNKRPDTDIKPRDVKYTSQCIVDTPLSTDKQSVERLETVPETDCLAECAYLTITVSQIEQDIGQKSFSHSPLAFDVPVKGVPNFPSENRHPIWYGKTRMAWPPDGEKISKIALFVLT